MNKILVVDDEKVIRANFCEILGMEGFSAIEASNGNEALEIYRKERPSAVLLDLKMPGMNGIDTLKALKEIDPSGNGYYHNFIRRCPDRGRGYPARGA